MNESKAKIVHGNSTQGDGHAVSSQKSKLNIKNIVPDGLQGVGDVDSIVGAFLHKFQPLEANDVFHVFVDARTKARYCECHIPASKLVPLSTTDVPLDPEEQPEYLNPAHSDV